MHGYDKESGIPQAYIILKFNFILFKKRLELVKLNYFLLPNYCYGNGYIKNLSYLKLGLCKENLGVSDIALTVTMGKCSKKSV